MKKQILFLFALSIIAVQSVSAQKIGGIRAGWHSATLVIDGESEDPLSAFYVGFFRVNDLKVPLLSISTGLEYFQNGFYANDNKYTKLHTLAVPIGLRAKLGPVFAEAGPSLNFTLGETSRKLGEDINSDPAFFDVPIFVGAGVKILMFTIEARYAWGLIDVYEGGTKSQYFQIGAGISL